ncbi:MAG: hypothetical protein MUC48_22885 [Leptolyngbya sp. Prado105]|jgi:hypothetical protein|nr:hypothetical protein [Leptolyngbya sp. Prado105]
MLQAQIDYVRPAMTVSSVLDRILSTGQIAQKDANWVLQAAMTLEAPLSSEEEAKMRAVFHRLGLGVLKVVY